MDCAWGADDIPSILETLDRYHVRATFFIVGQWAEKYPESARMIADRGHDIANHSYSHLRMGAIDIQKLRQEIVQCGKKLEEIAGKKVDLFRPPYGDYNNNVIRVARELGYYTIQWDVDSLDWKPGISAHEILTRISSRVKKGSILLFHNDTANTAKILPSILDTLKEKGFDMVPVSELILRDHYDIDYEGRQKNKN